METEIRNSLYLYLMHDDVSNIDGKIARTQTSEMN